MSYVPKRLASTAAQLATVSTSHLKAFPPKEAFAAKPSSSHTGRKLQQQLPLQPKTEPNFFDADAWAALQPPNPASLTAFAHRIGLGKTFPSAAEAVQQACTHPSFVTLYTQHNPGRPAPATNANLATLGNSLLGLFAAEHVNSTFPHLPTRVMKAAVSAYVGGTTCANVAKEMGAAQLLRWKRTVSLSGCSSDFARRLLKRPWPYCRPSCLALSPYRLSRRPRMLMLFNVAKYTNTASDIAC